MSIASFHTRLFQRLFLSIPKHPLHPPSTDPFAHLLSLSSFSFPNPPPLTRRSFHVAAFLWFKQEKKRKKRMEGKREKTGEEREGRIEHGESKQVGNERLQRCPLLFPTPKEGEGSLLWAPLWWKRGPTRARDVSINKVLIKWAFCWIYPRCVRLWP